MIPRFIWRNVWRNKRRALITMASVLFAVFLAVAMRSIQVGEWDSMIQNLVSYHSGYIQVHKQGYWNEQSLDNAFAFDSSLAQKIAANPRVKALVPRIESFALASNGPDTRGCLVVGTNPAAENALTGLKSKIVHGTYLTDTGAGAILGEELAKSLHLGVGDTVILLTQGYHGIQSAGKYWVRGVARFGSPELNRTLAILPLPTAQYFLGADGVLTSIALALNDHNDLNGTRDAIQRSIGPNYEVMTWQQLMPVLQDGMDVDVYFMWIMLGILYLVIAFGVFGTTLMMMTERAHELGMLVAIGMKRRLVALALFGETFLLSVLGTIAGCLLALPVVWFFQEHPIRLGAQTAKVYEQWGFQAVVPAILKGSIFIEQATIVFAIAILIGIYPMLKALRIDAISNMRRG